MECKISARALEDMEHIWVYTGEHWSLAQADHYVSLIFDEIAFIKEYPLSGRDLSQLRRHYRCAKVKSHLIFYRYYKKKGRIEIIRILHERMDIENHLST